MRKRNKRSISVHVEEPEIDEFDEDCDDDELQEGERTAKPNSLFVSRLLSGNLRTNQRAIDTNAARAALRAIGSHGAASLRPSLQRAAKKGHAALRQAALTGAAAQNLILCSALLTEVRGVPSLRFMHPCAATRYAIPMRVRPSMNRDLSTPCLGGAHLWVQAQDFKSLQSLGDRRGGS